MPIGSVLAWVSWLGSREFLVFVGQLEGPRVELRRQHKLSGFAASP